MVADRVGALIGRGLFSRRQARALDEAFEPAGPGGGGGGGAFGIGSRRAETTAWNQSVQSTFTRLWGTAFGYEGGYEFDGADNPDFITKSGSPHFDVAASEPAGWWSWTCRFGIAFTGGTIPTAVEVSAMTWWGDSSTWTVPVLPADTSITSQSRPYIQSTVAMQPFYRPPYDPLSDGCYFGCEFRFPATSGITLATNKFAWYDVQRLA